MAKKMIMIPNHVAAAVATDSKKSNVIYLRKIFQRKIKVLGPGCKNCVTLTDNSKAALADLGVEAEI